MSDALGSLSRAELTYAQYRSFAIWLGTVAAAHPCPVCDGLRWMAKGPVQLRLRGLRLPVRCGHCGFERLFDAREMGVVRPETESQIS